MWHPRLATETIMENPNPSEVLAAAQVLRRFNQYLNDQIVEFFKRNL
jgi:hypothetical protein